MNRIQFPSAPDEWLTPQALFDALHAEFDLTLDTCGTHANHKCSRYYTKAEDGLNQDWRDHTAFVNPPVSQISQWMQKAYLASRAGATVVCLVPASTDSKWWHRYAMKGEIRLLRAGKLHLPYPCAVVVFRPPGHALVSMGRIPNTPPIPNSDSPASAPIPLLPIPLHTVSSFDDAATRRESQSDGEPADTAVHNL